MGDFLRKPSLVVSYCSCILGDWRTNLPFLPLQMRTVAILKGLPKFFHAPFWQGQNSATPHVRNEYMYLIVIAGEVN